jgi:hypothetical protein
MIYKFVHMYCKQSNILISHIILNPHQPFDLTLSHGARGVMDRTI